MQGTRSYGAVHPVGIPESGITGTTHRVSVAIPNGIYLIKVRAIFADGSRSALSSAQQVTVGPAPELAFSSGAVTTAGRHWQDATTDPKIAYPIPDAERQSVLRLILFTRNGGETVWEF